MGIESIASSPSPVTTIPAPDELRVVICGSFRRSIEVLRADVGELRRAGATIVSPADLDFVAEVDGFALALDEIDDSPAAIEGRHLTALQHADAIWLHCPDGYVGPSAALELGVAHAFGVPVFARELPEDVTIRHYAMAVGSPHDAVVRASEFGAHIPSRPLSVLQDYYGRISAARGYASESAQDTLLLLTEEVGELARAVRKSVGLARATPYPSADAAQELADVQLYLLHLANILGVRLSDAVDAKERLNAARGSQPQLAA
jgi:NTP pyrophosphatase (non-canonical NTP hydrolase)